MSKGKKKGKKKAASASGFAFVADPRLPFRFQLPSGRSVQLPHLESLPIGVKAAMTSASQPIAKAAKAGRKPTEKQAEDFGQALLVLFETLSPGLTMELTSGQLAELLTGWQEYSSIEVGES